MKLKDFIENVLIEMDAGIKAAADKTNKRIYLLTNSTDEKYMGIDFDIAVTASEEAHGKAGAEISVVSIASIGAKTNAKVASEEVSRVKFTLIAGFDTAYK